MLLQCMLTLQLGSPMRGIWLRCEMGIVPAYVRGPIGIEDLTTYKYVILGNGQVR